MDTFNDLSAADPAPRRSALLATLAIGSCAFVELCVLATRGRFERMFTEFELELPSLTVYALGWALPTLLAIVLTAAIAKELVPAFHRVADAVNMVALLMAIGCLLFYLAGMFVPLLKLIQALS